MHTEHQLSFRTDKRDAVFAFLEAAQQMDRLALDKFHRIDVDGRAAADATHQLWLRQKCIEVIGSPQLRATCEAYTHVLNNAVWTPPSGTKITDFMAGSREKFLEAARVELDPTELVGWLSGKWWRTLGTTTRDADTTELRE